MRWRCFIIRLEFSLCIRELCHPDTRRPLRRNSGGRTICCSITCCTLGTTFLVVFGGVSLHKYRSAHADESEVHYDRNLVLVVVLLHLSECLWSQSFWLGMSALVHVKLDLIVPSAASAYGNTCFMCLFWWPTYSHTYVQKFDESCVVTPGYFALAAPTLLQLIKQYPSLVMLHFLYLWRKYFQCLGSITVLWIASLHKLLPDY